MNLASCQIPNPQGLHSLVEYALPFKSEKVNDHFNYELCNALKAKDGRLFSIKILPEFNNDTRSLLDSVGSIRIEIAEIRENDFMLFRIAFADTVKAKDDLSREVLYKLTKGLIWLRVIDDYDLLQLEFKHENRCYSIKA